MWSIGYSYLSQRYAKSVCVRHFLILSMSFGIAAMATDAKAEPATLTPQILIDLCTAPSFAEASAKGNALGWQKAPDDKRYRASMAGILKGPFQYVTWLVGTKSSEASLTYLDSREHDNGFWACSYHGKASISGLVEGLIARFGKPEFQEGISDNGQFRWKLEGMKISIAQDETQSFVDFEGAERQ